jgi:hypothetical protein
MNFLKSIGVVLVLAIAVTGCKKDKKADPTEKILLGKLSKTWTVSSVTLEDAPRTDFDDIELVVSGTFNSNSPEGPYDYDANGTRPNPSPWPATGKWSFAEGESAKSIIIRDAGTADEVQMSYELSTDGKELTLSFNVTGEGWAGSRTARVDGDWVFVFESN